MSALPEAAEAEEPLVPSLTMELEEEVTFTEPNVIGPMVWCTFKNFLSVTFILTEREKKVFSGFFFVKFRTHLIL